MSPADRTAASREQTRLRLDRANGKVFGVCSGLAQYMNVDPLIVRLVFVAGTLLGFGSFILIYLAIALLAE
ncbi:MAG TPA: PspC domain-containing protein [Croceibacterium sp.]|nr:PspC domain-containing protein [Croceibacterium sp.]